MDIELSQKLVTSLKMICGEEKLCEAAADAVVPDTQEDIRKILSSHYSCTIKSKDIDSGRITVRGELHAAVLYVPESGNGIGRIDITAPVSAEFSVPEADSGCFAAADMTITAADTRILNPRKLSVKAEILIKTECYKDNSTKWYEAPETKSEKLFFKTASTALSTVTMATEKTFTLDDEFSLPSSENEYSLLLAMSRCLYDSSERIGAKLIVRGHLDIKACVTDADGNISSHEYSSAFSQLFELPVEDGDMSFDVKMLTTGEYFEINGGLLCTDVHVLAQLVCTVGNEMSYISDAYACGTVCDSEYEELTVDRRLPDKCMTGSVPLRFDSECGITKVLCSSARVGRTELRDGKIYATVIVEVLFADKNGDIDSCRVRDNAEFDPEMCCGENIVSADARISELTVIPAGDSIDIRASVSLCCKVMTEDKLSMVCAMRIDDECTKCDCASLYLIKCDSADIWSIAKKYGSSESAILEANSLGEPSEAVGRILLIPVL